MTPEAKAAFEEMKRTEMLLDDMDYLTDSPRLKVALDAAAKFNEILDRDERTGKG